MVGLSAAGSDDIDPRDHLPGSSPSHSLRAGFDDYRQAMRALSLLFLAVAPLLLNAAQYELPLPGNDLVGEDYTVPVRHGETLLDIAREAGVGQDEVLIANPDVDRWLPATGTRVLIPARHILPEAPRDGLVLNLPEMRLYYYPPSKSGQTPVIYTYPVSVGRMGWKTPLGKTRVIAKQKDPTWYPPQSVRDEARAGDHEPVPEAVPPGPDNPLGKYALRLALPGYLIHGTNKPWGVGMRVTHGCIRLLPEHIEQLFARVPVGTAVYLVNQPVKLGWYGDTLYLEVHPPLEEDQDARSGLLRYTLDKVYAVLTEHPVTLDGSAVRQAVEQARGTPVPISTGTGHTLDNPMFR